MSNSPTVFDMNAPPAALAQAQADALNAAAEAVQAQGAHSGSTTPSLGNTQNRADGTDQSQLIALLVQGQQQLAQNQQQLQEVLVAQQNEHVVLQHALAGAPTPIRASTRHDSIAYDINNPGTFGTMSARDVKPNSALDFAKGTPQFSALDWLKAIEKACGYFRVDHPAAFASHHLIKEAGTIFDAAFTDVDAYSISWKEFREWLLNSPLHDRLADKRLLDDWASLQQSNEPTTEFVEKSLKLYGRKNNHPTLSKYPESFFVDAFTRGLHHEIQSRLHITDPSTTLASVTAEALKIGVPLEEAGVLRLASVFHFQPSFRGMMPSSLPSTPLNTLPLASPFLRASRPPRVRSCR